MKLLLCSLLFLLGACTPRSAAPPEAAKKQERKSVEPGEVHLDAELRKTAGIVVVAVQKRTIPTTLRVIGRVTPDEEKTHETSAIIDGLVRKIFVKVGDRVTAGQVLARMHSHDIHEARSEFQKAKVELARLEAQRGFAEKSRDRLKRLLDLKAASQEQLELAERDVRNTSAAIEAAKVELTRARIHIEEFLDVTAEDPPGHKPGELDHDDDLIPIKAPSAGIVLSRAVNTGTAVKPGDELFVISDLTSVWMVASVPEEALGKVRAGVNAQVFVRAFEDRPFTGRITRIGDQLDAETRTVQARIVLANTHGQLKPEMYATAEIVSGGSEEALYVPQESVQELNGHAIVFVQTGEDRFVARAVETGARAGGLVAIRSGLDASSRVAARGAFVLKSQMLKSTLVEE
ncbi:MAG: efflux RND transporter periplasmic adaptor subunit [Acidobacteria bacterium]|nr:efflux RND transporter periplasmic adaptor subunit [Acidobacteriota bacterium]